ncbi:uncharacterized protein G2W53_022103 [Senna tora]|uniref:Uncharacterized protein n=1 Tax=Senna tora TaxID=362788 RepID=A0A834TMF7_9FABA|nr:uncharacterized protein G2W53_022103 [Senna tora]
MSKRVVALVSQTDLFALDLGIRVDLMGLVITLKVCQVMSKHNLNLKSRLNLKRAQEVQV